MDDGRKKLIGLVERLGLFETLKLTDMPYVKLWSLIGDSWLTTDIIINFIKDLLSAYNPGGLTINDISDNTITYSETSDGVMEIDYLTPTVVYVVEFNIIGDILGHIKKTYEELSQDVLFEIFDLLTTYHDDRRNIKLQEQIRKVLNETDPREPSQYEVLTQQSRSNMAELERLGLNAPKHLQEEQGLVDQLNILRTKKDYLSREIKEIDHEIGKINKELSERSLKEDK